APDWEITGHNTVNLRAERSGKGSGRIYTITVECADGSGNKTTSTTEVSVSDNSIPITAVRPGGAVAVNKAAALNKQETATVESLQVNVYPNPAGSHFNIQIKSDNKQEQIKMQVFDVSGRRVEMRNNIAEGSTIQVGGLYLSGAYFLKVQQGYQHKEIKLIKLSE
ncbi:MAG TPA: T9SS type A sorting domain-containing protein, partial [Chitinophagaceae bacterium]|nr:T9SS type A sorting domain-containing protein [Chitinophagaceae bacterium]